MTKLKLLPLPQSSLRVFLRPVKLRVWDVWRSY